MARIIGCCENPLAKAVSVELLGGRMKASRELSPYWKNVMRVKHEQWKPEARKIPFWEVFDSLPAVSKFVIAAPLIAGVGLIVAIFIWRPEEGITTSHFAPAVATIALAVAIFGHFMQQGFAHYYAEEKRIQECVEKIAEAIAAVALRPDAFRRLVEDGISPVIEASEAEKKNAADRIDIYKKNWSNASEAPVYWGRIYMTYDQKDEFRKIVSTARVVQTEMARMASLLRKGMPTENDVNILNAMAKDHIELTETFASRHLGIAID
ncbi:Uncharacterised protein [Clostridium paraputrificum]|nr:Uncharacterised protein [Clostridium paraputrificum]